MRTRRALALLVGLMLLSISPPVARSHPASMADSPPQNVHPHDSPAMVRDNSPERQALDAEETHMPPWATLRKMDDNDGHGHRVHVVYTSVQMDNGVPTWHVGTASYICGGDPATPALEARIRAEFAAYTSAPVVVEPGWVVSSTLTPPGAACR